MSHVTSQRGHDETILFETRRHWWVYGPAGLFLALLAASFALPQDLHDEKIPIALLLALLAALAAFIGWLRRAATTITVTRSRLTCKNGLIARHLVEMNLDKVESVDVDQSVFGRIFGFGTVTIRGVGTTIDPIKGVSDPLGLRQAVFGQAVQDDR